MLQKRRVVSLVSWIALGVSILVTAGLWVSVYAAASGGISDSSASAWPDPWYGLVVDFVFEVALIGIVTAIVLDIVAGLRGGRSRLVALIGGFVLLSPAVFVALALVVSELANL